MALAWAAAAAALAAWYAAAGVCTALVYRADKRRAIAGRRRVPERRLRGLELAGGAIGAAIAQPLLAHKTAKAGYRAQTLLVASVQAAALFALAWLASAGT